MVECQPSLQECPGRNRQNTQFKRICLDFIQEYTKIVSVLVSAPPISFCINPLQIKHVLTCLFLRQHADKNCKKSDLELAPQVTKSLYNGIGVATPESIAKLVIFLDVPNHHSPLTISSISLPIRILRALQIACSLSLVTRSTWMTNCTLLSSASLRLRPLPALAPPHVLSIMSLEIYDISYSIIHYIGIHYQSHGKPNIFSRESIAYI